MVDLNDTATNSAQPLQAPDVKEASLAEAGEERTPRVPAASLLDALSKAFTYPREGIDATCAPLRALDSEASVPFGMLVDEALAAAAEFSDRTAEQLAYTRLFIGSLRMEAPPYASYYLEEEHTLNGKAAVEVSAIYNEFGIQLDPKEIAPADHLRYLLAFMALLAARYEETGEAAFAEAYAVFRDEYVLTWIDDFANLVRRNAEEPYYPALVALIVAVLKEEGDASSPEGD